MTTTPSAIHTATDWAAARSDKWRRQLPGLEAMLAPLDAPLIQALALTAPASPRRIADVGCGAGATTLAVLAHAPAGSVAHGFDLSPVLIEVARRRVHGHESAAAFEVADMGTCRPPARAYDRLVSRLGVMFFTDPRAAFVNLRRWLAPGGRFAFAVWGPVDDNRWLADTRAAVADVLELPPDDPTGPGPFRYADAAALVSLLADAGFVDVEVRDCRQRLPIGHHLPAPDAARFALASFSSYAELLADAGADAWTEARRRLTTRFAPHERDGVVQMPSRVHLVTGGAAAEPGGRS